MSCMYVVCTCKVLHHDLFKVSTSSPIIARIISSCSLVLVPPPPPPRRRFAFHPEVEGWTLPPPPARRDKPWCWCRFALTPLIASVFSAVPILDLVGLVGPLSSPSRANARPRGIYKYPAAGYYGRVFITAGYSSKPRIGLIPGRRQIPGRRCRRSRTHNDGTGAGAGAIARARPGLRARPSFWNRSSQRRSPVLAACCNMSDSVESG